MHYGEEGKENVAAMGWHAAPPNAEHPTVGCNTPPLPPSLIHYSCTRLGELVHIVRKVRKWFPFLHLLPYWSQNGKGLDPSGPQCGLELW